MRFSDDECMEMALAEARRAAEEGEVPVGAVLLSGDGEVLARAHNRPRALSDPTAHAEVLALREAGLRVGNYRLPGTTLVVTVEPCAMCVGAMLHARVARVVFGADDPRGGAAGSVCDLTNHPVLNHAITIVRGIRADECAALMRRFFRERRGGTNGEVPKRP